MKRELIRELEGYGIRYAEKVGVGRVKLGHLKTSTLMNMAANEREKKHHYINTSIGRKEAWYNG